MPGCEAWESTHNALHANPEKKTQRAVKETKELSEASIFLAPIREGEKSCNPYGSCDFKGYS